MEPHKFDAHIKKQLDERTINPSADAWNRVSDSLDKAPKKGKKIGYWVAASILVMLSLSVLFFRKQDPQTPVEVVKEEIKVPESKDLPEKVIEKAPLQEGIGAATVQDNEVTDTPKGNVSHEEKALQTAKKVSRQETTVAFNDTVQQQLLDLEHQKITEVATKIQELQAERIVSDEEIDALLLQAQKEIQVQRAFDKNTRVDAMALLLDAEAELEKPFKERVFELLKEGFEKAKTVVAERD